MKRRKFIQKSALLGGALMMSGVIQKNQAFAQTNQKDTDIPNALLAGVSDIHVHAAPDSKSRLIDELSFAREAYRAGYKSVMFKSNDFSSHDRAFLIRQALPDFECFGSLCMNKVHGDRVNVFAAEKAVNTTGHYCRCIWMPTQDATYQYQQENRSEKGVPVLDETGNALPEVIRVMEICAQANIIFATGHSSPAESIVLARKAKEVGVSKFVVTHANSHIWKMTHDQIKQCIDLGAFIEYSYITNLWGLGTGLPTHQRMSDEEFIDFVKIDPARSFITTDLGQVDMPHPLEGMRLCLRALVHAGISQDHIDLLVRTNPAQLVGLK